MIDRRIKNPRRTSRLVRGSGLGLTLLLCTAGCSWFHDRDEVLQQGPALGKVVRNLPALRLPESTAAAPDRDEVLAAYEKVYGSIADLTENTAVGKRMADLKMAKAEDADMAGLIEPYGDAVTMYETVLAQSTAADDRDQILYQLARAHDVQGQSEEAAKYLDQLIENHPDSTRIVEARFRRAEIHFSAGRYRQASTDYGYVVDAGEEHSLWQNANYMRGWSQFKLSDLDESLTSFFAVVANVTDDGTRGDDLSRIEQELLSDSLRVVTLALGYLDGPETLATHMQALDKPQWQYLAYEHLATDYLAKERYLDSVTTWQMFVDANPLDLRAPNAHIGMINTLIEADFPSEVGPKKRAFVAGYGVNSDFWSAHDTDARSGYIKTLGVYLNELASEAHSKAQGVKPRAKTKRRQAYLEAAQWYEQIVATFPEDPAVAEQLFLLGEVYTEAAEHGKAVASYQRVVRDFSEFAKANEAGYAAILGLDQLVDSAAEHELELWQRLKVDAQIEFALAFPADSRAPTVQTDAANSLFALENYPMAMELARDALDRWPSLPITAQKTNLLILGHGAFASADFVSAEQAYQQLLLLSLPVAELTTIRERLLATVYKQGEIAEQAGEVAQASGHYLRIRDIDAKSELAVKGHYDAVAALEGAGDVAQAAVLLQQFRQYYPSHELSNDIDLRLASMFEQTENWQQASVEYASVANGSGSYDVRRQALFRAAELAEEMRDTATAQTHYRAYAAQFPEPYDAALEVVQKLDEYAVTTGDEPARVGWLQRKIQIHKDMGRDASPRASYLAAQAQFYFAQQDRQAFSAIKLRNPLPKSLKAKTKSLKQTVSSYERVAQYKVAEFASASTFEIADLYAELSRSIMTSERPGGLSELELEQYDILLEEQAYPFEEQAITLHEINMRRSWEGVYDDWVKRSFVALSALMPARFDKPERQVAYVKSIY